MLFENMNKKKHKKTKKERMVWPSSFASKCRAALLCVMLEMVCAVEGVVEGDRRQL